jgi:hypothetical protein
LAKTLPDIKINTKIQLKALRTKNNNILFIILFFFTGCYIVISQEFPLKKGINRKDSLSIKQDTVKIDSIKLPKERLEDVIKDKAKDYKVNDFIKKIATLYNEAELHYKDIELRSGIIIIDYNRNLAYAKGIVDTSGVYTQRPRFKQGSQESEQDSLIYNFKTKKAVIFNADTEQEGMLIHAEMTKRENDSTIYMNRAEITTSKKKKRDYFIGVNNIKVIPNKKVVGGKSQLYLADVPTPIIFPFFYVPLTKGRASGILLPTWGDNSRQGYFLQNGGFYFAINDYVDLALTGDIYTNGSWGFRANSSYKMRYRFGGRFSFRYENLIQGQRGLSDYSKSTNFNISWSHNQDQKASPNSRFSASVNFGSSKFYRNSLNELSTTNYLDNNLSSSISYFKNFANTPFNMNIALTHSQNTNTETITMSLPNMSVNMDRLYPFAPKDGAKKNSIHRIGVTYGVQMQNNVVTDDAHFFKAGMFEKAKSGMQHNLSMSTQMKALKYITISPNLSFKEVWYIKTIDKKWNSTTNSIDIDTISGFKSYRTYRGNVSASTTLYGIFNFKKGRLKAVRHKMDISTSYGYAPDFSFYYDVVQKNILGEFEEFSPFDGGVFGSPSRAISQSVSFNIRNLFEAKVGSKDSTDVEYKKIRLLNNLDFATSYNLEADSLNWSPVAVTASTKLFEDLNLNFSAALDPYAIDVNGNKFNTFNINNGGSLFRLTNASITARYRLSNKTFSKDKKTKSKKEDNQHDDDQFGSKIGNRERNKTADKKETTKKVKLFHSKVPWNLSLDYSVGYSNMRRESEINRNTLRFNGSLELTPKWDISFSSGYDFKQKGLSFTRLGFKRDLDSWRMNFSWTPFGNNASYYFFIGVKASTLSDLKYDQHKIPDKRLF